jgi:hypothetical protein
MRALKEGQQGADSDAMADLACPVCSADLLFAGDERPGDEIFCTYCGSPYKVTRRPASSDDQFEVEEDF